MSSCEASVGLVRNLRKKWRVQPHFVRTIQYQISRTSLLAMADKLHMAGGILLEKLLQFLHCFSAKVPVVNCPSSSQPTADSTDSFL
jgi:hypothetical protein